MKLKRDINFYNAYTVSRKNGKNADYGIGTLPLILVGGVVLIAAGFTWLTYQNEQLQKQENELQEYLRTSSSAQSYVSLEALRQEYEQITLYNQMVQSARETISERPFFSTGLYEAMVTPLSGLGTLDAISQRDDTVTLSVTFSRQGSAAEYLDALANTGYFRTVSHNGWLSEGGYYAEFTCVMREEVTAE